MLLFNYKKFVFLTCFFLFIAQFSFSQGIIRGKVTDENGESVIGGIVSLKSNKLKAASTDLDGNFSLKIEDTTNVVIVISVLGHQTIEEKITLKKGEVLIKNFDVKPISKEIKEVVIEAKVNKARDFYMEKMKINSSTTIDFISSETIKKTGDANVSAAVARVSGVSTNGSFITVRGIGDRYVKTLINGSLIPTLDPLTNNIKLDLFPASLIDNLFITKTASADLPSDFSGALISIETKDFPDKLTVNIETTFGYNAQSTFKNYVSSQHSSTEWLGFDSDLRDINHNGYKKFQNDPSVYQQMQVLGLGDYYASIGVDKNVNFTDDYYKLGLIQLGLMKSGEINDPVAYERAKAEFNKDNINRNNAFKAINQQVADFGQSLPNNWNLVNRKAPLNFSQSFTIGNQINLFNRPLGFITGFRYSSSVLFDPLSKLNRVQQLDSTGIIGYDIQADQKTTRETNGWNALVQLSYKIKSNHSVSFIFMPNIIGTNNVRQSFDTVNGVFNLVSKDQFYEQRRQFVYQAKSQHFFPRINSKLDFNVSYTKGKSVAPDFKNLQYGLGANGSIAIGGTLPVKRFYRYLTDDLLDTRLKFEIPLFEKENLSRKLKLGGSYMQSIKESRQYEYFLAGGGGYSSPIPLIEDNLDKLFAAQEFGFQTYTNSSGQEELTINTTYSRVNLDSYHTVGHNKVFSGFALYDFTIIPKLKLSSGIRAERTDIFVDVFKFDSLGYAAFDERRFQPGEPFMVNPGIVKQWNFLPSANLIYKLKTDESAPTNIRLGYSKTIARPSVRELTETFIYDYEFRNYIFGNSSLKTVDIHNFDVRFESYFKSGDNVSVSLFYKKFFNHIELVQTTQGFSWQNADESEVKGIEIDARKKIVKGLDFRANLTFTNSVTSIIQKNLEVKSGVKKEVLIDTISRTMSGQAPYVLNGILSYNFDSLGLVLTASYNVQGPRLAIATSQPDLIPDVYEMPRHLFDFKVSKTLGKYFVVSATVKDIFNAPIRRSYKYKEGYLVDFDSYRFGTNYYVSLAYRF